MEYRYLSSVNQIIQQADFQVAAPPLVSVYVTPISDVDKIVVCRRVIMFVETVGYNLLPFRRVLVTILHRIL